MNGLAAQFGTSVAKKSKYKQYRRRKKQTNGKKETKDNTQQGTRKGQVKPKFRCYHCHEVGHKKRVCPKLQDLRRDKVNPSPKYITQTSTTSTEGKCARSVIETEQAHKVCISRKIGVNEDVVDVDSDARWWLQVGINGRSIRALYDAGASRTVMGQIGLQLARTCKREIIPSKGMNAKLANGSCSDIVGHVWLPFEVAGIKHDVRVAIMPDLDADCLVGGNFIRTFQTIHDPCENKLFIKGTKKYVDLEVTLVDQLSVTAISSIGLANIRPDEKERLKGLLDGDLAGKNEPLRCTAQMDEMRTNGIIKRSPKAEKDPSTEPEEEDPQESTSNTEDQETARSYASEQEPANSGLPGEAFSIGNKPKTRGRPRKDATSVNRGNAKTVDASETVSEAPGKRKPGRPKGSKKSVPNQKSRTPSSRKTRAQKQSA